MALNCEQRGVRGDGEPCGECASCQRIWSGSASFDVVEIDAASNRGVDDARDLRERAMYAPSTAERYKVYIVDEAHMLTREAWNALLKILEEPPPRVVFVFATTEPQKIMQAAAPVLSRLQRFDLKRIGMAAIRSRLHAVLTAEGVRTDDDAIALLARAADGSMRDALSLTDQVLALGDVDALTVARVREALGLVSEEECLGILALLARQDAAGIFPAVARLADAGADFTVFLAAFTDILRAQLAVLLGAEMPDLSDATRAALDAHRDAWSAADVLRMLSIVTEIEPRFRRSGQQQMLLETVLVRCALLDHSVAIEAVLRTLAGRGPDPGPRTVAASATAPIRSAPSELGNRASVTNGPDLRRPVSDRAVTPAAPAAIDAEALRARWPEIVASIRRDHHAPMLAAALLQAVPEAGQDAGVVTLCLTDHNDIFARALQAAEVDIVAAVRAVWPRIERIAVAVAEAQDGPVAPPRRMSVAAVRAEQVAALRERDAVLGAAIDALNLEMIE
jgi:DNA polymerase-3 subunit gamma/tau